MDSVHTIVFKAMDRALQLRIPTPLKPLKGKNIQISSNKDMIPSTQLAHVQKFQDTTTCILKAH